MSKLAEGLSKIPGQTGGRGGLHREQGKQKRPPSPAHLRGPLISE
jgi:hypothetical protein